MCVCVCVCVCVKEIFKAGFTKKIKDIIKVSKDLFVSYRHDLG